MARPPLTGVSDNLFRKQLGAALDYIEGLVGGIVGLTDGDKGDITVSGSGTTWNIDANAVGTTEIADGSVTFGKLAGAAVITSGETVASNDNDTSLPTTAAVIDYANSVGRVLLATKTASASATLDFTEFNNAVYSRYLFILENVKPATDLVTLLLRTSTNAGSSYDAGATDYSYANTLLASNSTLTQSVATGATAINLTFPNDAGNAAGEDGVTGDLWLYHAANGSVKTREAFQGMYDNGSGVLVSIDGKGRRNTTQDTDAVRFLFSSGNIASGTIRMFGFV